MKKIILLLICVCVLFTAIPAGAKDTLFIDEPKRGMMLTKLSNGPFQTGGFIVFLECQQADDKWYVRYAFVDSEQEATEVLNDNNYKYSANHSLDWFNGIYKFYKTVKPIQQETKGEVIEVEIAEVIPPEVQEILDQTQIQEKKKEMTMVSFLFAVLGSVTFWIIYIVVGLFVGTCFIRKFADDTYGIISGQETISKFMDRQYGDEFPAFLILMFILIFYYVLWFFPLMCIILYYTVIVVIGKTLWPGFIKLTSIVDKATPDISIKVKKNEEE